MTERVFISWVTDKDVKREKAKARELRNSQWWKKKGGAGICYYCGKRFKPDKLTMDHIVPIIRGGKTTKVNIVPCCKGCNSKKKYMLPMEWEEYMESLKNKEVLL